MIRRIAAPTVILLVLLAALPALSWTVEDCEEVNYDHPHCDQYPTTTTYQTTTTQPEVTTTQPEVTTTTPTTTTVEQQETTTTTAAPCPEGFDHQPPLCVGPTTTAPEVEVSSTVVTAAPVEELPFTGFGTSMLAAASSLLLISGLAVLGFRRRIG